MLRSGSSSEIHNKYIDLNIDNRQIGKGLQILSKDHLVGRVNLTTATMWIIDLTGNFKGLFETLNINV